MYNIPARNLRNKKVVAMAIQTTYTTAKSQFARLWDEVTDNQEVVIIKRRGAEDVALISASELIGLILRTRPPGRS